MAYSSFWGELYSATVSSLLCTLVEWKKPMGTIIKINFDGAYNRQRDRSASCIVARDAEREVLVLKSENHEGVPSTFAAEAIVSHRAV
ncbi:hypothetical protein PVK06_002341 [Gossypium arboreum]|uniref:RNase H type-1 domain-containing protein n=1 Tax=Gossypium arboreum TaxID=29729 RepID=A0ABR0R3B5_GOSAR|nr:hypothetical protein PVK06_002341 [Gossypium arboreum]